jgi:hypothetical protein
LKDFDNYFLQIDEPNRSCLLALKSIILQFNPAITTAWKYSMPFFCFRNKMFCYFWINKKTNKPYIGFVEGKRIDHPLLLQEKRSRMKIYNLEPDKDIPIEEIKLILQKAVSLYPTRIKNS